MHYPSSTLTVCTRASGKGGFVMEIGLATLQSRPDVDENGRHVVSCRDISLVNERVSRELSGRDCTMYSGTAGSFDSHDPGIAF
jgi:hypothetical protein